TEQRNIDDESNRAGDGKRAIAEESEGKNRVVRVNFRDYKRNGTGDREDEQANRARRRPRNNCAAEGRAQDDGGKRYRQQDGAKIVYRPLLLRRSQAQDGTNEQQNESACWQVNVEDPAPRKMID